eukprot:TRINITY_DN7515_c1_g2_i2.p1 TRINITY_DN7515_c1_g2~~TRINITY_DN7515_c1_g2_i2.p1  ORF type:complete len:233 (+),score=-14.83 TRINITY_DN7515_c1_g2_i2:1104-1802(+)
MSVVIILIYSHFSQYVCGDCKKDLDTQSTIQKGQIYYLSKSFTNGLSLSQFCLNRYCIFQYFIQVCDIQTEMYRNVCRNSHQETRIIPFSTKNKLTKQPTNRTRASFNEVLPMLLMNGIVLLEGCGKIGAKICVVINYNFQIFRKVMRHDLQTVNSKPFLVLYLDIYYFHDFLCQFEKSYMYVVCYLLHYWFSYENIIFKVDRSLAVRNETRHIVSLQLGCCTIQIQQGCIV